MDLSKLLSSIDDDILAEVISGCEGKMGEPFAKKPAQEEMPAEQISGAEEALADGDDPAASDEDLTPEELEELLKLQEA